MGAGPPQAPSPFQNPVLRGAAYQVALVAAIGFLLYEAATNAIENLTRARIASGFGFLGTTAGFDINQTLIPYSSAGSTYGAAFLVGLLNTLVVAAIGIALATVLGFLIGIARLSTNWLIAAMAAVYVETLRNIPLLLQILFWYFGVLAPLPLPRQSIELGAGFFLNVRGFFVPRPVLGPGASVLAAAVLLGVVATLAVHVRARRRQAATGRRGHAGLAALGFLIGLPALVWIGLTVAGTAPVAFEIPQKGTFNLRGGLQLLPEFVALVVALSTYTAAFIAEIVRAGILSVPKGQIEAAKAMALRPGQILRLVVMPQALRVIIPPLTSQYLNVTKNSSLAVAIGYPDLVQVFMGTVLNQTGQAIEVVAITMAVYLAISLSTSAAMNAYNRRMAIVER